MKITTEMIQAAYSASADAYHGRISRQQAINELVTKFGMNRGSASDSIVNFKKIMDGEKYTRTGNEEQTNYILTHILNDYGVSKLSNAIKAVKEHVEYYEGLGRGNLNRIRAVISRHEKTLLSQTVTVYPDELDKSESLFEGMKKTVSVNIYERNQEARTKCIECYGFKSVVCGCDFEKVYGDIGKGFIHVHHLTQLSDIGQGYEVDPVKDLRPVCPNCHAMLHKKSPPYTIDEMQLNIHTQSSVS